MLLVSTQNSSDGSQKKSRSQSDSPIVFIRSIPPIFHGLNIYNESQSTQSNAASSQDSASQQLLVVSTQNSDEFPKQLKSQSNSPSENYVVTDANDERKKKEKVEEEKLDERQQLIELEKRRMAEARKAALLQKQNIGNDGGDGTLKRQRPKQNNREPAKKAKYENTQTGNQSKGGIDGPKSPKTHQINQSELGHVLPIQDLIDCAK